MSNGIKGWIRHWQKRTEDGSMEQVGMEQEEKVRVYVGK